MLSSVRFALLIGLSAAIPMAVALDPPQSHKKQESKEEKKKAEPAKKDNPPEERIDRRNSRMKERAREIDQLLNEKQKK